MSSFSVTEGDHLAVRAPGLALGPYRLQAQLGAGRDGVAYAAKDQDTGRLAEVCVITSARADVPGWERRTRRLRLAALLHHPAAVRVLAVSLESDPPYVALEAVAEQASAAVLAARVPLSTLEAVDLCRGLADVLAAAHRLGLSHGRLCPGTVQFVDDRSLKLDFTGLEAAAVSDRSELAAVDAACRAPEARNDPAGDAAADVYSLGVLCRWLVTGQVAAGPQDEPKTPLGVLILSMLATDPAERPSARQVADRLAAHVAAPRDEVPHALAVTSTPWTAVTPHLSQTTDAPPDLSQTVDAPPDVPRTIDPPSTAIGSTGQLGRFRLLEKLGEGGMGAVYRAEDAADGSVVAVKVLRPQQTLRPGALKRFHKEARMLAEVNNPYVANLLEINEDGGTHYLVIEYVAGQSLAEFVGEGKRLEEAVALAVMADVARALADAHGRGIVHRDIKPENILLARPGEQPRGGEAALRVKLSDFGLARHVVESESLDLTRTGTILGTPFYMAPEQCSGKPVDPRADVYAMGTTLFRLLAGRPPFVADSPMGVITMHLNEPPPPLQPLNSAVSDGLAQVVAKCLAKAPDDRYADAAGLLRDLERLLRGEPTGIVAHPRLPACDPQHLVQYDWTWELEASPAQLWPYVSNTERLNRAVGLPGVAFSTQNDPEQGMRRFGQFRKMGLTATWEEHPFEWVEARRMGVVREYTQGPFKWLVSIVELAPRTDGGTNLAHRVRLEPRGLLGRTAAAVEVGLKGHRAVDRVYRRIDATLTGKLGDRNLSDPFEEPANLSDARRRRLDALLDRLGTRGVDPGVVERFGDFLALASPQEIARIRPLALARRLGLDPEQVVAACLHGAREGLLVLMWDLLCPVCRIPSEVRDTLRALREHGRCEACNVDFELDFANSVEMIFRAHPEVRDSELGVYCIGGPVHSPHVVAQVRVGPAERIELELALAEGSYRLRGPQLPFSLDFWVQPGAPASRWDLELSRGLAAGLPRTLRTGRQVMSLANDREHELVVRVERTAPRDDALTAARASALALFRELFPGEVLAPGQLVSVATVTFLVTDLASAGGLYERLGDARAFGVLHEHFRLLNDRIRQEGGALVKTIGEGAWAVFNDPVAAARVALDLPSLVPEQAADLRPRAGVHRGPAWAATLNDHLDYFGTTVNQAARLQKLAGAGEVLLSQAVMNDPQVAALLRTRGLDGELVEIDLPGQGGCAAQRVVLAQTKR